MGYGQRHMRSRRTPAKSNPEIIKRIVQTITLGGGPEPACPATRALLSEWERSFLGSILESAKKWGRLTAGQHDILQRIEKKLDPDTVAASKTWNENYTPEMREKAIFAANYYRENPPYFADATDRILANEDYIPSEKLYRKMVENNYVQRAMKNSKEEIKYPVGSMVTVRNSAAVPGTLILSRHRGEKVIVITAEEKVTSATKGGRKYMVLPIGADQAIPAEERYLKK